MCGNVIEVIDGDIKSIKCCNKELELLVVNTLGWGFRKTCSVL